MEIWTNNGELGVHWGGGVWACLVFDVKSLKITLNQIQQ